MPVSALRLISVNKGLNLHSGHHACWERPILGNEAYPIAFEYLPLINTQLIWCYSNYRLRPDRKINEVIAPSPQTPKTRNGAVPQWGKRSGSTSLHRVNDPLEIALDRLHVPGFGSLIPKPFN
jgi:hypothetical protein